MEQRRNYADGGKVIKDWFSSLVGSDKGKKAKKAKPSPEMLGKGAAAKAGKALKSRRKEQMKELGL